MASTYDAAGSSTLTPKPRNDTTRSTCVDDAGIQLDTSLIGGTKRELEIVSGIRYQGTLTILSRPHALPLSRKRASGALLEYQRGGEHGERETCDGMTMRNLAFCTTWPKHARSLLLSGIDATYIHYSTYRPIRRPTVVVQKLSGK
jgi:hypothetical protein